MTNENEQNESVAEDVKGQDTEVTSTIVNNRELEQLRIKSRIYDLMAAIQRAQAEIAQLNAFLAESGKQE